MSVVCNQLTHQYLSNVPIAFPNFELKDKEQLLLLGESGRGKTTLLHLLAGILPLQGGDIHINKTALKSLKKRALDKFRGQNIGLVFQQAHFVKSLSVMDNLLLAQKLGGKPCIPDFALEILNELNMGFSASKKTYELSVGEQQRVSIARAIINKPALILADEPTSALDDKNAAAVCQLLCDTAQKVGANLIVVTHDKRLQTSFSKKLTL